jgi:hypothetical protein
LELLNSQVQDLTFYDTVEIGSKTTSKMLSNQRVSLREHLDNFNFG